MLSNPVRHLPRSVSGGDRAVLIGLAALAALVAGVWLTGELAALVASGTTVWVGPGDLARVLTHLPDHLADPARAWPPRGAARAPRPGRLLRRRGDRHRQRGRGWRRGGAAVALGRLRWP